MSNTQDELRAYHKQRFALFLALDIVCVLLFGALIVFSFFLRVDTWMFWVVILAALLPLSGVIVFGRLFNSHLKSMQELDLQKRRR